VWTLVASLAGRLVSPSGVTCPEWERPRTAEWQLHKVPAKLGIHSRRDLGAALPRSDSEPVLP
jgi:hypothetical protein